jgi:gliding motility-associated-like protein
MKQAIQIQHPSEPCLRVALLFRFAPAILLFIAILLPARAQKQNNQWRFGNAGISFNTSPPSQVTPAPALSTTEGSASVADRKTGLLLFYTDGVTVWNAQNQVMENGTGLRGGSASLLSSTTAAVIVPHPGNDSLYYIVTVDEGASGTGSGGVCYNLVDMRLAGGLGAVAAGQKNIFLDATPSERLEVVPDATGNGLWIITHNNSTFSCYRVSDAGISAVPVVSEVGGSLSNTAGHLKANRQFNQLACGSLFELQMRLFNFNNATGQVSDRAGWPLNTAFQLTSPLIYGVEFSPDGQLLYISNLGLIYQFNISLPSPEAIAASAYQVDIGGQPASMQLGPDGKIYINNGLVGVINCPDKPGPECGYATSSLFGGGYGLPKWVYYPGEAGLPGPRTLTRKDSCAGAPVAFSLSDTSGITSLIWSFGDPGSGSSNSAEGNRVTHTFSEEGSYIVQAILTDACGTDTLFLNPFQVVRCSSVCTGQIRTTGDSCTRGKISFSVNSAGQLIAAAWDFGDPASGLANTSALLSPNHIFSDTGTFSVRCIATFDCGTDTLFTKVRRANCSFPNTGKIVSGPDSCRGNPVSFSVTGSQFLVERINWDFGDPASGSSNTINSFKPSHIFSESGTYIIRAALLLNCGPMLPCFFYDTLYMAYTVVNCPVLNESCRIDLPNTFIPDGDGQNDAFPVVRECTFDAYQLSVFNRWGKRVFETQNPSEVWEGNSGGAACSEGVYFYLLEYRLPRKEKQKASGTLFLFRNQP